MAIKVNGTTVINDSRQLQNVASLDATTVAAIGNAGVGGITKTVITDSSAYTNVAGGDLLGTDSLSLGTSQPASADVIASRTISSGAVLASMSVTTGNNITLYDNGAYYGAMIGIALWDGSNLTLLDRTHDNTDLSGSSAQAEGWIESKSLTSGVIGINPGDILYCLLMATYPSSVGGASWAAGQVNTTILELS